VTSMGLVLAALTTSTTIFNPHRGAALPAARAVLIVVPVAALGFYLLVVRRHRP